MTNKEQAEAGVKILEVLLNAGASAEDCDKILARCIGSYRAAEIVQSMIHNAGAGMSPWGTGSDKDRN